MMRYWLTVGPGKADSSVTVFGGRMRRVIVQALAIAMVVSSLPVSAAGPGSNVARTAATGTIVGTAASANGQTLPNATVYVRDMQNGTIAGSTTSNAIGRFSFAGLHPGRYVVEVARQSAIVGSSSILDVATGATVTTTVNTAAEAGIAYGSAGQTGGGGGGHGVRTAVIITTIAAGAGIAAAVAIATNDS